MRTNGQLGYTVNIDYTKFSDERAGSEFWDERRRDCRVEYENDVQQAWRQQGES